MKIQYLITLLTIWMAALACNKPESPEEILEKSIAAIDTVETVIYKQDMWRTNPRYTDDTLKRFREMVYKRLKTDSIVGVMGHWNMYLFDKTDVVFEDIYDGVRLIRKNNRDSVAAVYDLTKYPAFKETHFWGHNTPFGMQHEFRFALSHPNEFQINRLKDTSINDKECFRVCVSLENYTTMPGFAMHLEEAEGTIIKNVYFFDKQNYFPVALEQISYNTNESNEQYFLNQYYYDVRFNQPIDEQQFNTSNNILEGFTIREMEP